MMGDMCPQDMDPICPYNAKSRMVGKGSDYAWGKDKGKSQYNCIHDHSYAFPGCQCLPDFLLALVMIQPTSRMVAVSCLILWLDSTSGVAGGPGHDKGNHPGGQEEVQVQL